MDIYFVTGNSDKLREAGQILEIEPKNIKLDLDEIQGLDPDKIAKHKARQAWNMIKKPLVIWDQSLYISCLNGFPGPLIKWFWETLGLKKICQIANLFDNHKISTKTTLTYYDGNSIKYFYGEVKGIIPTEPRGEHGFAWDPIFIPNGYNKTFAEMTSEEKNAISMHRIALEKLRDYLSQQ